MKWFDSEKELWVMIVTGAKNSRAFCAGADLKEWLELYIPLGLPIPHFQLRLLSLHRLSIFLIVRNKKGQTVSGSAMPEGFCGISQRKGLKPIIAAVNGYAFGIIDLLRSANISRRGIRNGSQLVGRYIYNINVVILSSQVRKHHSPYPKSNEVSLPKQVR